MRIVKLWNLQGKEITTLRDSRQVFNVLFSPDCNTVVTTSYANNTASFTYNAGGEIENGQIYIQLKATDYLSILADQKTITFTIIRSDLELCLAEPMPCILIVYDAKNSQAYWLYIQAYFESIEGFNLANVGDSVTVSLSKENILNIQAIKIFAKFKNNVLSQLKGVIRHHG